MDWITNNSTNNIANTTKANSMMGNADVRLNQSYFNDRVDYFSDKRLEDKLLYTTEKYDRLMEAYSNFYKGAVDPYSMVEREQFAEILHNTYPQFSKDYYLKNAESFMKQATGIDADLRTYGDHLSNVWKSACMQLNASMGIWGTMLKYAGDYDSIGYKDEVEKLFTSLSRSGADYRKDIGDEKYDNLVLKMISESVGQMPHQLINGGLAAIEAVTSFIPVVNAATPIIGGIRRVSDFLLSGMMEGGGLMLDMIKEGYDPSVVMTAGSIVGVINGALEMYFDDILLAPLTKFGKALSETGDKVVFKTARKAMGELAKDLAKSMVTEPLQEVAEEWVGMYAQNLALAYEHGHGRMEDSLGFSRDDFRKAAVEVSKATLLSTPLMTLGSGLLGTGLDITVGDWGRTKRASKYVDVSNKDFNGKNVKLVRGRDIKGVYSNDGSFEAIKRKDLKSEKAGIPTVTNILGSYYALGNDNRQNNALASTSTENGEIYAVINSNSIFDSLDDGKKTFDQINSERKQIKQNMQDETADTATLDDIREVVDAGIRADKFAGASFLDNEFNEVESEKDATYVAIASKENPMEPAVVKIVDGYDESSITSDEAKNAISMNAYGQIYTNVEKTTGKAKPAPAQQVDNSAIIAAAQSSKLHPDVTSDTIKKTTVTPTISDEQNVVDSISKGKNYSVLTDITTPAKLATFIKSIENEGFASIKYYNLAGKVTTQDKARFVAIQTEKDGKFALYKTEIGSRKSANAQANATNKPVQQATNIATPNATAQQQQTVQQTTEQQANTAPDENVADNTIDSKNNTLRDNVMTQLSNKALSHSKDAEADQNKTNLKYIATAHVQKMLGKTLADINFDEDTYASNGALDRFTLNLSNAKSVGDFYTAFFRLMDEVGGLTDADKLVDIASMTRYLNGDTANLPAPLSTYKALKDMMGNVLDASNGYKLEYKEGGYYKTQNGLHLNKDASDWLNGKLVKQADTNEFYYQQNNELNPKTNIDKLIEKYGIDVSKKGHRTTAQHVQQSLMQEMFKVNDQMKSLMVDCLLAEKRGERIKPADKEKLRELYNRRAGIMNEISSLNFAVKEEFENEEHKSELDGSVNHELSTEPFTIESEDGKHSVTIDIPARGSGFLFRAQEGENFDIAFKNGGRLIEPSYAMMSRFADNINGFKSHLDSYIRKDKKRYGVIIPNKDWVRANIDSFTKVGSDAWSGSYTEPKSRGSINQFIYETMSESAVFENLDRATRFGFYGKIGKSYREIKDNGFTSFKLKSRLTSNFELDTLYNLSLIDTEDGVPYSPMRFKDGSEYKILANEEIRGVFESFKQSLTQAERNESYHGWEMFKSKILNGESIAYKGGSVSIDKSWIYALDYIMDYKFTAIDGVDGVAFKEDASHEFTDVDADLNLVLKAEGYINDVEDVFQRIASYEEEKYIDSRFERELGRILDDPSIYSYRANDIGQSLHQRNEGHPSGRGIDVEFVSVPDWQAGYLSNNGSRWIDYEKTSKSLSDYMGLPWDLIPLQKMHLAEDSSEEEARARLLTRSVGDDINNPDSYIFSKASATIGNEIKDTLKAMDTDASRGVLKFLDLFNDDVVLENAISFFKLKHKDFWASGTYNDVYNSLRRVLGDTDDSSVRWLTELIRKGYKYAQYDATNHMNEWKYRGFNYLNEMNAAFVFTYDYAITLTEEKVKMLGGEVVVSASEVDDISLLPQGVLVIEKPITQIMQMYSEVVDFQFQKKSTPSDFAVKNKLDATRSAFSQTSLENIARIASGYSLSEMVYNTDDFNQYKSDAAKQNTEARHNKGMELDILSRREWMKTMYDTMTSEWEFVHGRPIWKPYVKYQMDKLEYNYQKKNAEDNHIEFNEPEPVAPVIKYRSVMNLFNAMEERNGTIQIGGALDEEVINEFIDEVFDNFDEENLEDGKIYSWLRNKIISVGEETAKKAEILEGKLSEFNPFETRHGSKQVEKTYKSDGGSKAEGTYHRAGDKYKETIEYDYRALKKDAVDAKETSEVQDAIDDYFNGLYLLTFLGRQMNVIENAGVAGYSEKDILSHLTDASDFFDIDEDDLMLRTGSEITMQNSLSNAIAIKGLKMEEDARIEAMKNEISSQFIEKEDGTYIFNEEHLADIINGSSNNITKKQSKFLASMFANMPEEKQNEIIQSSIELAKDRFKPNIHPAFIFDSETGKLAFAFTGDSDLDKVGAKGATWEHSAIILAKDSDFSTVLHEGYHLINNIDTDMNRKINKSISDAVSDKNSKEYKDLRKFAEANKHVLGSITVDKFMEDIELFANLDNLSSDAFRRRMNEASATLYEMWCCGDKRGKNSFTESVRQFFEYITNAMRKAYNAATGRDLNVYLNKAIEDNFYELYDLYYSGAMEEYNAVKSSNKPNAISTAMDFFNSDNTRESAVNFGAYNLLGDLDVEDIAKQVNENTSVMDIISKMEKDGKLAGISRNKKNSDFISAVLVKLSDIVESAITSPTVYAKKMSRLVENISEDSSRNELMSMMGTLINAVTENTTNANEILNVYAETLSSELKEPFFNLVRILDNKIQDKTVSITDEQLEKIVGTWISKDGELILDKELFDDKYYTNPIIEMAMYNNSKISGQIDSTYNPFTFANEDYLTASQYMIEQTQEIAGKKSIVSPNRTIVEMANVLKQVDYKKYVSVIGDMQKGEVTLEDVFRRISEYFGDARDRLVGYNEEYKEKIQAADSFDKGMSILMRNKSQELRNLQQKLDRRDALIEGLKEDNKNLKDIIALNGDEKAKETASLKKSLEEKYEAIKKAAIDDVEKKTAESYKKIIDEIESENKELLTIAEDEIADLQKSIEAVEKEKEQVKADADKQVLEMAEKLKLNEKETKEEIARIREETKKAIEANDPDNLRQKVSSLTRRLEEKRKQYDELKNSLEQQDDYIRGVRYKLKKRELVSQLESSAGCKDARYNKMLTDIVKTFTGKNKGIALRPEMWNDSRLTKMMGDLLKFGLIAEINDENGNFSHFEVSGSVNDITLDEFNSLIEDVKDVKTKFDDDYDARISAEKQERQDIIDSIKKSIEESFKGDSAINQKIRTWLMSQVVGSDEYDRQNKDRLSNVIGDYELMSLLVKRVNPALYAYMFGGQINGKYNAFNLNSCTNAEMRETSRRRKAFVSKIAKTFGVEEKDVQYKMHELFDSKSFKVSEIDYDDFEKKTGVSFTNLDKNGVALAPKDMASSYYALATIRNQKLNEQKNARASINENIKSILSIINGIERKNVTDNEIAAFDFVNFDLSKVRQEDYAAVQKLLTKISEAQEKIDSADTFFMSKGNEATFTAQKLIGIYIGAQNPTEIKHMLESDSFVTNNLTYNQILSVVNEFETNKDFAKYKEIADFILEDMEEVFPRMSDTYYQVDNKILAKEFKYFPVYVNNSLNDYAIGVDGKFDMNTSMFIGGDGHIDENMLKDRQGGGSALDLNVISNYLNTIDRQEHYIAFRKITKEFDDMFSLKNKDGLAGYIQYMFKDNEGEASKILSQINNYNQLIKGKRTSREDRTTKLANKMRNNYQSARLWLNVSTVLQQVPTVFLAAKYAGFGGVMNSIISYFGNKQMYDDFVFSHSEQMKNRSRMDIDQIRMQRNQATKSKYDEFINKIWDDGDVKTKEILERTRDFGLQFTERMDRSVSNIMWMAVYNRMVSELKNAEGYKNLSASEFETAVSDQTTQIIMDMISNSNVKDNAFAYSNPDTGIRSLLMFTNQLTKQWNMIYNDFAVWSADRTWESFKPILESLMVLSIAAAGSVLISGEALPTKDDEDGIDKFAKRFFGRTVLNVVEMTPAVGSLIQSAEQGFRVDDNIISRSVNLAKVLTKKADDRTEHQLSNAIRNEVSSATEMFFGIGTNAINKTGRALTAIVDGDGVGSAFGHVLNYNYGAYGKRVGAR